MFIKSDIVTQRDLNRSEVSVNLVVCKESQPGETRVALSPDVVAKLTKTGLAVLVEQGAGTGSSFTDQAYRDAGAEIVSDRKALLGKADILLGVQYPDAHTLDGLKKGAVLVSFVWAKSYPERVKELDSRGIITFSMDAIPRTSRAQTMDALSSMSNIAGYKAVLLGADALDRYLPMMMTAAGTVPPAKALILGAGVAGLQAIATAKRLGAVVEAFDVRPAVKEQVESLGAKFVDVQLEQEETETKGGYAKELSEENKRRQAEALKTHIAKSDLVITTALIPGKPAPKLITTQMVEGMKPGSVVVDIAAEQGGNCELTKAGETVIHKGVKILGPVNLPAQLASHASQLYAKNLQNLLALLIKDGALNLDFSDDIIADSVVSGKPAATA